MRKNIINKTDSYKFTHHMQYPPDTERVYSYFESRPGAEYPETLFFGLQYLLKEYMVGSVVTWDNISRSAKLSNAHFGDNRYFNYKGWAHIMEKHGGRLPLRIKAVPEGTKVPTGNVMMTVENTDPACYWLTNAVESLLTHVWYPSTVATASHDIQNTLHACLNKTAMDFTAQPFMDHDFGYRGASSDESAAIGGAAHLISSKGTDTIPAIDLLMDYYGAEPDVGLSVAATEHSVMTALGREGEFIVLQHLLTTYPAGILSVVADSYNIYNFVSMLGTDQFKKQIRARNGVFVVRPDSITDEHPTPHQLAVWIVQSLWDTFGGTTNDKGFRVLRPCIRVLWGDGINAQDEQDILMALAGHGFSAENIVFGMGGARLQKVNRDTQQFAFKCSAQMRGGDWYDVFKVTPGKNSKAGRLRLVRIGDEFHTVGLTKGISPLYPDLLETVFENGKLIRDQSFDNIRELAAA